MSKVVDSVEFTDGGGKIEKKITINLGDGVAREQSARAVRVAEEAMAFAGTGVTDSSNVNAIILACSCYDYAGNPIEIDGWFNLYIGWGDNGVTDLEIEHDSGELYRLVDGYNELFWDYFGCYMRIYVSYRNAQYAWTDVLGFKFTNVVARSTSYALLQALSKGAGIVKLDNPNVLSNVILACYVESIDEYGVGVDITDRPWVVYEDRDEYGTCVGLRLKQTDTEDEYYLENGGNDFELNDGSAYVYIYANLDVLDETGTDVDEVFFKFTKTTTEVSQYALWKALTIAKGIENAFWITQNDLYTVKEQASGVMDLNDPNGEYVLQMLVRNADGSLYKGNLDTLDVNGVSDALKFDGLYNRRVVDIGKYIEIKNPNGLRISMYWNNLHQGRYPLSLNTVSKRQNVSLLMYEELIAKQEAMNQERDAQNIILRNFMTNGSKPTMVWRNEGDTHYAIEYSKKWADTPNMFKTDDGKLQDILMLDCTGVSTFYKAFEVGVSKYAYRKLRSVKGICNYGNVASFQRMFYQSSANIESVQFVPEKVTKTVSVQAMFGECRRLTHVNMEDVEFTSVESCATYMFTNCSCLKKVVMPALPGVTDIGGMFAESYNIEYLDMSKMDLSNVSGLNLTHQYRLEHVIGINNYKKSYSLAESPLLTYESIKNCINGLYDLTEDDDYTPQSLTLHSNGYQKLSEEDIEIATNKGWNIIEA